MSSVLIGTIVVLFEMIIIITQVIVLSRQIRENNIIKKDIIEFKLTVEDTLKRDVAEIVRQHKDLLKTIHKMVEQKI